MIIIEVNIYLDNKLMVNNKHNFRDTIKYELPLAHDIKDDVREVDSDLVLYGYKLEPLYFKVGENKKV